MFPEKQE